MSAPLLPTLEGRSASKPGGRGSGRNGHTRFSPHELSFQVEGIPGCLIFFLQNEG